MTSRKSHRDASPRRRPESRDRSRSRERNNEKSDLDAFRDQVKKADRLYDLRLHESTKLVLESDEWKFVFAAPRAVLLPVFKQIWKLHQPKLAFKSRDYTSSDELALCMLKVTLASHQNA